MCNPKKFPRLIFCEANNRDILEKSLVVFKNIRVTTLQKISFEIFSNLFYEKPLNYTNFKQKDYVEVKVGVYKGDMGKITKVERSGMTVQLVPRVNFEFLNKKLKQVE